MTAAEPDTELRQAAMAWLDDHARRGETLLTQRQLAAFHFEHRCSMCRLRHAELLDAAHILPDGHPRGQPVVPNGLSLCKIHHAAYDQNFIGVRPDLVVEVRRDILDEIDGPMLTHGLQQMNGGRLTAPRQRAARPDPDALEERYETFRSAI